METVQASPWMTGGLRESKRSTRRSRNPIAWRIIAGRSQPGDARGLLSAWPRWESIAGYLWPAEEIPDAAYGILRLRVQLYRGRPWRLSDGTAIRSGSLVGQLHCDNATILRLVRAGINPFVAARADLRSLAASAKRCENGPAPCALYGVSILTRAARRLGFEIRPQRVTARGRLERIFFAGLLILYTEQGVDRMSYGRTPVSYPQEAWISRGKLIRLYGNRGSERTSCRRAGEI